MELRAVSKSLRDFRLRRLLYTGTSALVNHSCPLQVITELSHRSRAGVKEARLTPWRGAPRIPFLRPEWRNGRRSGLKIRRPLRACGVDSHLRHPSPPPRF